MGKFFADWSVNSSHFSSSDVCATQSASYLLPSTFENYLFRWLALDFPLLITPFSAHQELQSRCDLDLSVGSSPVLKT